jgi:GMP synthase (glutamine-hydrolysing)
MSKRPQIDKIIIVDFGSQVTKLIARRVRENKVFSEILTIEDLRKKKLFTNVKGIILSGGPSTVTKKLFPQISKEIFDLNIPILGICYGLQLIVKHFKGKIKSNIKKREFGRALLYKSKNSLLT